MSTTPESKKKCRQYKEEYLLYGFTHKPNNPQIPVCLICDKDFTNHCMKPSKLSDHLVNVHPSKANQPLEYFKSLAERRKRNIITNTIPVTKTNYQKQLSDGLLASYNISLLIAKAGKPHSIGEDLLMPVIHEVLKTVVHHSSPEQIIKRIPLSNNTVRRRIDEMAADVEEKLCDILKNTSFSLQIDESTLPSNEALLLAYVRFIREERICEEMLFARTLLTNKTGSAIFKVVETFFNEKGIPLTNILACATDGEPAMIGQHKGFLGFLKKAVPGVLTMHCVIHRQHLVAKNLSSELHEVLNLVIKAVNKIKANALNSRLFTQLCKENDEDFESLVLHTAVRWLSKGNCLSRFFSLYASVLEFLDGSDAELSSKLKDNKASIAYLTDIYGDFNFINKQLQGNELNMIRAKSVIEGFIIQLRIKKMHIRARNFKKFPTLKIVNDENVVSDADLNVFENHLEQLHKDMNVRFADLKELDIPQWVAQPMNATINLSEMETITDMEEELLTLQTNHELMSLSSNYQRFWLQKDIAYLFPTLWDKVKMLLIAFPSSYLVERGFSAVSQLLGKQRLKMDIVDRGDLRMNLTNIEPDLEKIVSRHQAHPAHGKAIKKKD